ncbi:MAG: PIN domain-containing protein [Rhodomicrobium sp.]
MAGFTALLDACVLYPAPLRDLLIETAKTGIYRARWSDAIHDEWIAALLERRPDLAPEVLARTRELMNMAIPDCLVTGYEDVIPSLQLPDPDDRHVLAAAIAGRADVIVTFNLKDFPDTILSAFGLEAQHPDTFLSHQMSLDSHSMIAAVRKIRRRLTNPQKTPDEYLSTLRNNQLVLVASELEKTKSLL